jgi:hypothetical protein
VRNDFATYAAARWPALVAFLVDDGADRAAAEEEATAGLARVRPRWRDLRDDHDLDEQVLALVTGSRDPARGRRFLTSLEVERTPDELPRREPPVAEIVERAHHARRRTALRWGAVAVALVLVAGVAWLVAQRLARPPGVHEARNPLPIPWYSHGQLHLADVTVERPQVLAMVRVVDGGVVTLGRTGEVAFVDHDGRVERIGHSRGGALAVDQDRDLVAWDDDGGDAPRLVVHDVADDRVVASHPAPSSTVEVLAIDQGDVWFRGDGDAGAWSFGTGSASRPVVSSTLDAAAGATVNQSGDDQLQLQRSFAEILVLRGRGADLSLDGRRLLTARSDSNAQPVAYDAVSGAPVDLGVAPSEVAITSVCGPNDSFLFALRHAANAHHADDSIRLSESGPILLVQCRPGTVPACETLTQLADDTAYPPVLAE